MNSNGLSLGDRMKRYEQAQALHLTRRVPVIVRVDGRAFHGFTRGCRRPYDPAICNGMVLAAEGLAGGMDGCRLVYVQSDEASFLLTDFARLETEAWFAYDLQKVVSLAAAGMTALFAKEYYDRDREATPRAEFDARAFNIPQEEVANYFLWRARDWHRNSVLMFAQAHFSPKAMHGKKLPELHEMLHGIGRNWATETTSWERNGTFLLDGEGLTDILPTYATIAPLVEAALAPPEPCRRPPGAARARGGRGRGMRDDINGDRLASEVARIAQLERVVRGYGRLLAAQIAVFVLAVAGMIVAAVLAHHTTAPGEPVSRHCWALLLGACFGYWVGEYFWLRPWRTRLQNEGDAALCEGAPAPEAEG